MAAVNIHSDFGAQENTICTDSTFPPSICHDVMGLAAMILFISMLNFKTAFHSPLSPSTRGHLVPLHFVTLVWYLSLLIFLLAILFPAWDSLSLAFAWWTLHIILTSRMAVYSFVILLSQFWTSLLFHVCFKLLLLALHSCFSGDKYGGLVFPSLEEFSTVYCDP